MRAEPHLRLARLEDVPAIFELLKGMAEEWPMVPVNHNRVFRKVHEVVSKGLALVVTVEGTIVASAGLAPAQWWFSDEWFVGDFWVYVDKRWRRTRIAALLLGRIKEMAREMDMPIFVAVHTMNQASLKNRLYRRFFKPVGETFVVNMPEGRAA